jgi:hypothetical protein
MAPVTLVVGMLFPAIGAAATWAPVTGPTSSIQEVGQVRSADGTLHVVWIRDNAGANTTDVLHVAISAGGGVSSVTPVAPGFSSASNPAIVNVPGGGLETFFGGIQCLSSTCPTGLFSSSSRDRGKTWSSPVLVVNADQAYASDVNATTLADGTPFQTWWHTTGTTVHRGTDPATPGYDFQGAMGAGCCGYYSNLAADTTGHLQLAWDSNATGFLGVWSRAVDPATGAPSGSPLLMPGSVTSYAGAPSQSQMLSRTPIVAAPGRPGVFFVAYPGGYPTTTKVLLWQVGSPSSVTVVNEAGDHNQVSLAADAAGRLWVFWSHFGAAGDHVHARRITASGPELPIDLGAPAGTTGIFALDGAVAPNGNPEVLALVRRGNGTAGTYYRRGPQLAPVPPPVLGKAINGGLVSGQVLVKLPGRAAAAAAKGHGFVPLTQDRQLPVGTQVDARRGTIELVASTGKTGKAGKTQTGVFSGGLFKLGQDRRGLTKGLTTLSLVEGAFAGAPSFAMCRKHKAGDPAATQAASPRVLQILRAKAHGRFRTRGRFSAGTVRGTEWGTQDRCDGTLTIVRRGTVLVTDFRRHRTIAVRAGHRYLATAR